MKKLKSYLLGVSFAGLLIIVSSCKKDEGFTQVSDFERSIHNLVNQHRVSVGKSEMTHTFLLMDDAQEYSAKMANETVAFGTAGIAQALEEQRIDIGGDATGVWVGYTEYEIADTVVNRALRNPDIKTLLESDFNLSAVGTAKDANGNFYITHLLMHKP